jgi:hypothetical protein
VSEVAEEEVVEEELEEPALLFELLYGSNEMQDWFASDGRSCPLPY